MGYANRAELRTAVLAELAFTSGEIADSTVNRWIALCEDDLNRQLRGISRQEAEDISISSGDDTVSAPTGFRQFRDLWLSVSPRKRVVLASIGQVRAMQAAVASGVPRYVAVVGATSPDVALIFGPVPDAAYTGKLTFWKSFDLSDDTDSTAVLNEHSDVYLYGTLIHAEAYLGNDPRIATWEALYYERIATIKATDLTNRESAAGAVS